VIDSFLPDIKEFINSESDISVMASSTSGSASQVRQKLLQGLLDSVKQCQVRYGGKSELATGDQDEVICLCRQLELVLNHGLKDQESSLGLSVIRNVRDLVGGGEVEGKNLWKLLKKELNAQEQERFMLLNNISTDLGRGRAWIRSSLNEQSLEKFIHSILRDKQRLIQYYEEWAFFRDQERCVLLPSMAAGLTSVRFALRVDDPELNGDLDSVPQVFSSSLSSLLPVLKPSTQQATNHETNPVIAQESETEHVIKTSKIRTKVKKKRVKAAAQVISFDEGLNAAEPAEEAVPESPFSPMSPFNSQVQDDSFLFKYGQEEREAATRGSIMTAETRKLEEKKPTKNSSSSSLVSDGSEVGKEKGLTLSFDTVSLDRLHTEEEVSDDLDIYTQRSQCTTPTQSENPKKSPKFSEALTPITNKDIGALFPVKPGEASSRLSMDLESEQYPEFDYTPNQTKSSTNSDNVSFLSAASAESSKSNRSLGKDDLRKALLSVMEKKEELEQQLKTLRTSLDYEVGVSRNLKAELDTVRQTKQEQVEKLESRNSILSRENELLKHQLKKYVGAVQKLRDGPQAYETLAKLETQNSNRDLPNKYIDYHFEASEYEKKLIQVAEMHGELLEFNESLQRNVQSRDAVINRLRAELVSLRGPLPNDQDDTSSIAGSEVSYGTSRVLVNIWIPSVFLAGSGSSRHHVYQVYVRIRDTEWNVYRRYNQFHDLHVQTRKSDPVVAEFHFPPKKSMGHRSERFVESRRKQLQAYLRNIVNYLVGTHPSLANCPDKETFIDIMPFFSDALPNSTEHARTTLVPRRSSQTMARLVL